MSSNDFPKGVSRASNLADAVLRLIWVERQISRADIARRTGIARSTVSEIVATLLPTGLVAEVGVGVSRGGRRPIVLQFQDDAHFIVGIEVGAAHVGVVLMDLRGNTVAWNQRRFPVREDPEGTRGLMIEMAETIVAASKQDPRSLVGIGVAVPSPVDPKNPGALSEIVLPAWNGRSGFEVLQQKFGVPLWVDNDANLGALAEHWWGEGRGLSDFAYVKVATGVGSGHVISGEIYRGATGVAGEIGHMAIAPRRGPACMCGLRGCLTTMVGRDALRARTQELAASYPGSPLASGNGDAPRLEDAALKGDPLALAVVREAAEYLGIAMAGLINLMNPSMVILGGDLARLGDLVLDPLRETVRERTLVSSVSAAEIRTSELGPRSVAIGAATQVLKAALEDSRLFPTAPGRAEAS